MDKNINVRKYDPTKNPFDNYYFPNYNGKCQKGLWITVKDAITFAQSVREKINHIHEYGIDTSKLGELVMQLETELETTMHKLNV
jgi:hypothetical protein